MKVREKFIPEELKKFNQWVCWKRVMENGKESKIPIDPKTGGLAKVNDPLTWGTFKEALQYYQEHKLDGIGFVFTKKGRFVGIDLDNCRDAETGKIEPWAKNIIIILNSYTEVSPSGSGIRIIVKGELPKGISKKGDLEICDQGKYLTITGRRLKNRPKGIKERPKTIRKIYDKFFDTPGEPRQKIENSAQGLLSEYLSDAEIIRRAKEAKNGDKFARLWGGDIRGYKSRSEADQALMGMLAYWTGNDRKRMDRLFCQSRLGMRKKSDRQDYRDRTISEAIASDKFQYDQGTPDPGDDESVKKFESLKKESKKAAENILKDSEMMNYLTVLLVSDRPKYEALLIDLKNANVTSRDIDSVKRAVNDQKKGLKRLSLKTPLRSVRSYLPDAPVGEEILIPPGWDIDERGVLRSSDKRVVANLPVLIKRKLRDLADRTEHIELVWRRSEKWVSRIITRQEMSDTKLLIGLSLYGFRVNSVTARLMVEFLDVFEAYNDNFLPEALVTHQLGWQGKQGKHGFLFGKKLLTSGSGAKINTPGNEILPVIRFKGRDSGEIQIASGFRTKGDFIEWSKVIPLIQHYPMLTVPIYVSLSSFLNPIFHTPNFIMDWASGTSSGKTTALKVAASCHGNPNQTEKDSIVRSWDATATWLERASNVLKNLPFFIDDTQRARGSDLIKRFIYAFSSGQGGGRGTPQGILDSGSWETVALSCGESKITNLSGTGGTYARVISLWGLPFKEKSEDKARLARKISMIVDANYGHVGPKFARYLINHRKDWGRWRKQHPEILRQYRKKAGGSEVAQRQAEYFVSIHMAAIIAEKALGFPFDYEAHLNEIHQMSLGETSEADRAEEAYQLVQDWVLSRRACFWPSKNAARAPMNGWLGIYNYKKDLTAIIGLKLTEFLKEHQFDPDAIIRTWAEKGLLETTGEERGLSRKVSIDGGRLRAYLLKMNRNPSDTGKGSIRLLRSKNELRHKGKQ